MANENQLEFVRGALGETPPSEWADVAKDAKLALRTLYHVSKPYSTPSYGTVFDLYVIFKERAKKGRKP